ncbi:MAG TPA: hypothetical protein ENJ45_05270, partial [Phaeodactylibacter sp.]|nr:hypothetical protein [Phaeodactylibacter sp.]
MLHLLQLEWKKFHKNRVFRILAILYLMVLPSIYILAKAIPKPKIAEQEMQSFFMFPNVWKYIGFSGNWAVFFLFGFGVILSITLEYHYKTIRQNIITGLSRQSYFMAKVIWIFALAVAATLYYILVCGIIGFIETDTIFWSKVTQEIAYIPRYFLMSFGFMSVAMLFGLLLRKTGLALILYLMYNIVLEPLLRYGVHMRYFKNKSMHFYPMN